MLLSVIIPAYNEESLIEGTLRRIGQALRHVRDEAFHWEIIVCDNNSTDKTDEIAARFGARVTAEPVNQISRARNSGAEIARGDWLLFVDADSYPPVELIGEVWDLIRGGKHIGCGATVDVRDGTLFNKLRIERLNPLFRLFRFCGGAFLLCRADAFGAIGGFSPALFVFEEIDFVARLKRYGGRRGKQFAILHRHPVVTSGRKGEYRLGSLVTLAVSDTAAVLLLLLHFVLPRRLMPKRQSRLFGYWYPRER